MRRAYFALLAAIAVLLYLPPSSQLRLLPLFPRMGGMVIFSKYTSS
ncbi:hypothetical protein [Thermococcus peptonophilus]